MKNLLFIHWSLPCLLAAAAVVVLTGCVGVMPLPVTPTVEYGQKVPHPPTLLIRPGQTTRAEVITALGTNHVTFPRTRSLAYTWEMRGGGGVWWAVLVSTHAAVTVGGNWVGGWRGFFVAFDERDIVRAASFKTLSARHCLDENMDRWVAKLSPAPSPAVVTAKLPPSSGEPQTSPLPPRRW